MEIEMTLDTMTRYLALAGAIAKMLVTAEFSDKDMAEDVLIMATVMAMGETLLGFIENGVPEMYQPLMHDVDEFAKKFNIPNLGETNKNGIN